MSMDKRWKENFERLEAIEKAIHELKWTVNKQPQAKEPAVTKKELMEIKGVGSSTADEILELLNS